jgi:hypothetical protein
MSKTLRVKRIPGNRNYGISEASEVMNLKTGRILKQSKRGGKPGTGGQYFAVRLSGKAHYVHVLMLQAYVGPRPFPRAEARHLNDDKLDNRLENLCWGTQSENNRDRVSNGIHHYGPELHTHCPKGHLLDGRNDKQRFCIECRRERGRARRAAKTECPQGHSFDGLRYRSDGTVRQRYCTTCAHDALNRGRATRWSK